MRVNRILAWASPICLVFTQGKSEIGINAYTTTLTTFDASTAPKAQFKQTPEIGLRYLWNNRWGVDFALGGGYNDGAPDDSVDHTVFEPGTYVLNTELGIFFKALKADKAYLGVAATGGISFQSWTEVDKPEKGTLEYPGAASYNQVIPYGLLALEPGYFFNDHFSLYSRIGMNVVHIPDSKYIDTTDADFSRVTRTYPLKSRNDANNYWSISQLGLGVRFYF